MPPMDRRPPLAVSPRRLRPRRNLRPVPSSEQTPPASMRAAKPTTPARYSLPCDHLLLRPEFQLISSQLMEMAKMAKDENDDPNAAASVGRKTSPLFERGRFYEVYSARRNERLRRKQGMEVEIEETVAQDPLIAVELAKRRNSKKKAESLRKSVPANFSASQASSLRSSVRSSGKEIKKAAALGSCVKKSAAAAADVGNRIGTRSIRRI